MSKNKKVVADLLFIIQIVCTIIFGGGQFVRMLATAQGVSMSWFIFWEIFLIINLILALKAHKNQPSRVTWQTIGSYTLWVIMVTADLGVMVWKGTGTWSKNDTITAIIAGTGILATLIIAMRNSNGINDPIAKGWLAVFFKATPQLMMAIKIMSVGAAGLAGTTVITGHITVLTRLGQLAFSIKEAGWDRNRKGSAISELANEGSWVITTIAWLMN